MMFKNTNINEKNLKSFSNKPLKILGIHKDPWHNTGACVIRDNGKERQIAFYLKKEKTELKIQEIFQIHL